MPEDERNSEELLQFTTEILAAYMQKNPVAAADLPELIATVHGKLASLGQAEPEEPPEPAVPVKRSVTDDHIVCLECGRKLKMLKRHLATDHGMTPAEYRARWGLMPTYPMVSASHSEKRQEIAQKIGLGRRAESAKGRGRKKAES